MCPSVSPGRLGILGVTKRKTIFLALLISLVSAVQAEGSRMMFPNGLSGGRAAMELANQPSSFMGQIARRQFIYVYAQKDEYILLASSARKRNSLDGEIMVYFDPDGNYGTKGAEMAQGGSAPAHGTLKYTCTGSNGGVIRNRAQELAGPGSVGGATAGNQYVPCAYRAEEGGIYGIVFMPTASATSSITKPVWIEHRGNFLQYTNALVAWDVTVRATVDGDGLADDINGRVFTYAWNGSTGNIKSPTATPPLSTLFHTLYYITSDGYRYMQTMRGINPIGYALYANSAGFWDNGNPLYHDLLATDGQYLTLRDTYADAGVSVQAPEYPIFFSDISPGGNSDVDDTLSALGIPLTPPVVSISNLRFTGNLGGIRSAVGVGGRFSFTSTSTMTYQLVISADGVDFDPANLNNRVLRGIVFAGNHDVSWDGKNGYGTSFAGSQAGEPYSYQITGRNGEIHFPMLDIEANDDGGPTITRLNGDGAPSSVVYFDDRGYTTSDGTLFGELGGNICGAASAQTLPEPDHSLTGIDSNASDGGKYYRWWEYVPSTVHNTDCVDGSLFGDAKVLDLWALVVASKVSRQDGIKVFTASGFASHAPIPLAPRSVLVLLCACILFWGTRTLGSSGGLARLRQYR